MNLKAQYLRLFDKAQGKSLDPSMGVIYTFEKYCKACGVGLNRPKMWDKKTRRKLFRGSFCSDSCRENGEVYQSVFGQKAPKSDLGYKSSYPVEEMAFIAAQIKRSEQHFSPIKKLIIRAIGEFALLSEQLSFLEFQTNESWSSSKMRYHLSKK